MPFTFLTAVLAAGSLQVEPEGLTFGPVSAALEFSVPGAASVELVCASCGGGSLSAAEMLSPGHFRARFTFPKERFPRVVLLAVELRSAQGERQREWVALPLSANASLKLETKPRASVTVSIGQTSVGPRPANAKGKLTVPVVVPPGFAVATVVAGDRAGNVTTTTFDLKPQPFPRAAAAAPRHEALAGQTLALEVFAVQSGGAPLTDVARLHLKAKLGTLETPVPKAPGVFTVGYRAPEALTGDADEVTVAADDAPPTHLLLQLRPGAADRIALSPEPDSFIAGSGIAVKVTAKLTDHWGNPVAGAEPRITSELGAVRAVAGGAVLTLPDVLGGKREVHLHATAGAVVGDTVVAVHGGPAVSAELKVPSRVEAGAPVTGTLTLKDTWGNPADAREVTVSAGGRTARLRDKPSGELAFEFDTRPDDAPGPLAVEAATGTRPLTASEVTVFPFRRPWGFTAGALVGGGVKFSGATDLGPRLFLGLRLGKLPLQLGLEGGYTWFPRWQAATVNNLGKVQLDMREITAGLTARFATELSVRLSLHFALTLGVHDTRTKVSSPGQLPLFEVSQGPFGRAAGGLGLRVPGGQLVLEAEYGFAPLGGPNVKGNALGAGLALGYFLGM